MVWKDLEKSAPAAFPIITLTYWVRDTDGIAAYLSDRLSRYGVLCLRSV